MSEQLHSINEVLQDLKAGKPVIIVDDESRENEGDLIIAAEFATQENINFMVKYARGIVCTPMRREALEKLGIPAMVTKNTDNHETAFTVTVDHVDTTTGVSPAERAYTIQKLLDPIRNLKISVVQVTYFHLYIKRVAYWYVKVILRHLSTFVA